MSKLMSVPGGKRSKFLKYWWETNSVIDPNTYDDKYYRVFYDFWGRAKIVESYDQNHHMISFSIDHYHLNRAYKTEVYNAKGEMEFYFIRKYRFFIWVTGMEKYSANGGFLELINEDV